MSLICLPQDIQVKDIAALDRQFIKLMQDSRRIQIDAKTCTKINSVGVAMLLSWRKRSRKKHIALVFDISDYLYDYIDYLNIVSVLGIKKRK